MAKKLGTIALILAGVVAAYLLIFASQSVQVDLTNAAVNTINASSPGKYGDAKAFLNYWPIIAFIVPGAIGLVWIAIALKKKSA